MTRAPIGQGVGAPADAGRATAASQSNPSVSSKAGIPSAGGIPAREEWAEFGPEYWPLDRRHLRLPKWAQKQIRDFLIEEIDREMRDCCMADVRELARISTGGNCTFADDDIRLMAHLAARAVDAGLIDGIGDAHTQRQLRKAAVKRRIAQAIEARRAETGTGSVEDESAVPEGDAP